MKKLIMIIALAITLCACDGQYVTNRGGETTNVRQQFNYTAFGLFIDARIKNRVKLIAEKELPTTTEQRRKEISRSIEVEDMLFREAITAATDSFIKSHSIYVVTPNIQLAPANSVVPPPLSIELPKETK